MRKQIYGLLIVLWCLMMGTAYADSITITVYEQAEVKGPLITLGEMADISGDDTERVAALQTLKLGNAPQPGKSTVLTSDLIYMRLSASGTDFSDVVWQMPDKVNVTTLSQTITGQSISDCAIQAVRQQMGTDDNGTATIDPVGQPLDANYAMGEVKLTAELPHNIRFTGLTPVKVNISIDGRQVAAETVKLKVKMFKEVVVAAKTTLSSESFTADSIKLERMDISRLPHGFLVDKNKVIGLSARRIISPGMVICSSMLEKPVVIKRGNKVTIIARVAGTEITVPGQAMQDGTENQIIRVQNLNSQKIISAKILDATSVLVITNNGK